jgi:TRAP-type C4-dicarboxylate transport system substrate-binding protein
MSAMNLTALKTKTSVLFFALLLALAASGCSWTSHKNTTVHPAAAAATAPAPIITPDYSLAAKVVSVNTVGRFVVMGFPASQMPKVDQTLFLYRNSLKVAEVRVTGPQSDNDIVADLTSGEAQVGDTVRDQ